MLSHVVYLSMGGLIAEMMHLGETPHDVPSYAQWFSARSKWGAPEKKKKQFSAETAEKKFSGLRPENFFSAWPAAEIFGENLELWRKSRTLTKISNFGKNLDLRGKSRPPAQILDSNVHSLDSTLDSTVDSTLDSTLDSTSI